MLEGIEKAQKGSSSGTVVARRQLLMIYKQSMGGFLEGEEYISK